MDNGVLRKTALRKLLTGKSANVNIFLYLYSPYRCVITNFGRCMPSNTTRQFILTNMYGQHVSATAISHHQASHRKTYKQNT
jgi:hypothetical protein